MLRNATCKRADRNFRHGYLRWPERAIDRESEEHVRAQRRLRECLGADSRGEPLRWTAELADFHDLLWRLLEFLPEQRLSAHAARQHAFVHRARRKGGEMSARNGACESAPSAAVSAAGGSAADGSAAGGSAAGGSAAGGSAAGGSAAGGSVARGSVAGGSAAGGSAAGSSAAERGVADHVGSTSTTTASDGRGKDDAGGKRQRSNAASAHGGVSQAAPTAEAPSAEPPLPAPAAPNGLLSATGPLEVPSTSEIVSF